MPKIALIGAGSIIFCKTLVADILATPALRGSTLSLMSPTRPKLDAMADFVRKMIAANNASATVEATTDRREALRNANYVIIMIQVGGIEAYGYDYKIPLKYGIDQCIADSLGPGGVFRGLRTIPVLASLVDDMHELCPNAVLLNYANPMGICTQALSRLARFPVVGLCHGVQTTLDLISRYVDIPKENIDFLAAGINHMAWFLELREHATGRDLYPTFRERMERPEYYINEKVRGEVMRQFGYFMTESTGHLSEYLPWFRSSRRALEQFCDQPDFGGASGAYYHYSIMMAEKYTKINYLDFESPKVEKRSVEYCSYILEALETGRPFRFNGNVRNDGYITNLPAGCCVEVPVYADANGLHPNRIGDLPIQCAALNRSNVTVQELAVEAALTGDPELVVAALALDPLTSAVATLPEIRSLTRELLAAEAPWLPQFAGKTLRDVPYIATTPSTRGVEVPADPALVIANRFGKLAEQK